MRRLFVLTIVCCGLCLVAATPRPVPTPRPAATPTAAATIHFTLPGSEPIVLIYPFDTASGLDAKVGTQVAGIFSKAFTQGGGITVLPVPTGIKRANFLTNAHAKKADYYITGYVTPIGESASVVVQVVSVTSGVIVYSQTSQVGSINDAISLALTSYSAIMQMSGTSVSVETTESASAAPTAAASNGAQFNLGHIFSHHASAATSAPTSSAAEQPGRGVILVAVHAQSGLSAEALHHATQLLAHDLAAHFRVRDAGSAPGNLATAADALCGTDRNNTIATGTLVQQRLGGIRPRTKSHFTLQIWTCFGDVLYETSETDFDVAKAISTAVGDYVTAHPAN